MIRLTTTVSVPEVVVLALVSAHCSPSLAPAFTHGKKSARNPCTRAAASETFTASSSDSLPLDARKAWNSAPLALSNTAGGTGEALSPRIESTTIRTLFPPVLSASVRVTKLEVVKERLCLPLPAAVASRSWVVVWSTRYLTVRVPREAGCAAASAARVVQATKRATIVSSWGPEA